MYKEHIQKMPSMAVKGKKKRRIVTEFETRTPQISHRSAPPSLGHIPNSDPPVPGVLPQEVDSAEHPLPKR